MLFRSLHCVLLALPYFFFGTGDEMVGGGEMILAVGLGRTLGVAPFLSSTMAS